jgi:hypothetical protein
VPKEYWNLKKEGKLSEAQDKIGGPGFGVAKIEGKWQVCEIGEKMENADIADTFNTVLKMAKKRAYVDGILSATAASDIFTQDIEDMQPQAAHAEEPASANQQQTTKPAAEAPKALECQGCAAVITQKVHDFSKSKHGKPLCMECQGKEKK